MDKARKKNIKRVISLACIAAVVGLLAAMPLIAKQDPEEDGPKASILTGSVATGSIYTELIGGGTLAEEDAVTLSIPAEVKLKSFLVSNGQAVTEGTAIATVDRVTVMKAISQVQETLEYLSEQIEKAGNGESEESVTALAGGIVKILYAEEGEAVQNVMLEHGALAVLSLDGLMAVDMEGKSPLPVGTEVTVTLSDGTVATGKIVRNLAGEMTVTLEDDGYPVGDQVQVIAEDGTAVGSGGLYIYSPWNATAYAGIVDAVEVQVGQTLSPGDAILVLGDVGYSSAYRQLIAQRQEYEALMLELFKMYQTETVTAPCDGVVSGIDQNSVQMLSANGEGYQIMFLANSPNGDDDTLYTNFVGKVTAVGQNGWALLVNPQPVTVTDYTELSAVPMDESTLTWVCTYSPKASAVPEQPQPTPGGDAQPAPDQGTQPAPEVGEQPAPEESKQPASEGEKQPGMTENVPPQGSGVPRFSSDPVYELENGEWKQISYSAISQGDILLFAVDQNGEFVWVVRVKKADAGAAVTPGGTGSAGGSFPSGGISGGISGSYPSGGMTGSYPSGGMTGSYPSGSMPQQESAFTLYGLDMAQIAAVTPVSTMTVEITVDELDVNALQLGMTAQVKIDALGGEKYTAAITEIGNTGTSNGGNSKFTVELTMDRTENMLSGMNATVIIVLSATADVLTVPADALVEQGNQTLVYTGYDEENDVLLDPVAVKVGASDGENVEILEGLVNGQTYYYAYYDTLEISFTPDFGGGFLFG